MKKSIVFIFLFSLFITAGFAQELQKGSVAKLTYNADKSGNLNEDLRFNSSFFVTGYSVSSDKLVATQQKLKALIAGISSIQLTEMDDKQTLMVIIDVNATGGKELSEKFRKLFTELGVETVSYNEIPVKVGEFKF